MLRQTIELKFSFYFFLFLTCHHFGAAVGIVFIAVNIWLKMLGLLVCVISYYFCLMKYVLLCHSNSIVSLKCNQNKEWVLKRSDLTIIHASLMNQRLVTSFMVILSFKVDKKFRVVLFKDSCNEALFRNLLVLLRH